MDKEEKKKEAAKKALEIILSDLNEDTVLGIGTGSTTNYFIQLLNKEKINIKGLVCSSNASQKLLEDSGPMNKSLNKKPEKIAPNAKIIKGINIIKGDSCIFFMLNF